MYDLPIMSTPTGDSAAPEMRDIRSEDCFYGICMIITTFDSPFTFPVITIVTASIKSVQYLLPSEILTAILQREWHKTGIVFCNDDQNVAADARAGHNWKLKIALEKEKKQTSQYL